MLQVKSWQTIRCKLLLTKNKSFTSLKLFLLFEIKKNCLVLKEIYPFIQPTYFILWDRMFFFIAGIFAHYLQGLSQILMFSFREIIFPGVSPCSNRPCPHFSRSIEKSFLAASNTHGRLLQSVPINIKIKWQILYRLRSMVDFLMSTIVAVFQLKHQMSKTPGLEIFKMWSIIFISSKLTEILQKLYKFQFI